MIPQASGQGARGHREEASREGAPPAGSAASAVCSPGPGAGGARAPWRARAQALGRSPLGGRPRLSRQRLHAAPNGRLCSPLHGCGHSDASVLAWGLKRQDPRCEFASVLLDPGLRFFWLTGRELASPPVGLGWLSQHGLCPCPRSRQSRACGVARTSGPPSPRPRRRPCLRSRSRCRTTGGPPRPAPPPHGHVAATRSCTLICVSAQDAAHPGPGQPVWGERPAGAGRGPGPRAPSRREAAGRPGRHSVSLGPLQPHTLPGRHLPPAPPTRASSTPPRCGCLRVGGGGEVALRARGSWQVQEALTAMPRRSARPASQSPVSDEPRAGLPPQWVQPLPRGTGLAGCGRGGASGTAARSLPPSLALWCRGPRGGRGDTGSEAGPAPSTAARTVAV